MSRTAQGLVVVATSFIPKPLDGGDARFELETVDGFDWTDATPEQRKRLKRTSYLTRDERLFDQANEHLEGSSVALTWQPGKRKNGEACKVATAITSDTTQPRVVAAAVGA